MTVSRCLPFSTIILAILGLAITAPAYEERLILATTVGACSLRMEADDQSHTLRLRVLPEGPACQLNKTDMQTALQAAFSKADHPKLEGPYTSLFLGRIIDYPWLSQYLAIFASHDSRWDGKKGKPFAMDLYSYVRSILDTKEVITQFEETFGNSGYRVTSVTIEKVLVGPFHDIPFYQGPTQSGKFPYDALIWLSLEKKVSEPGDDDNMHSH